MLSMKRRALPVAPAYCITTHKSQGQTLNKVVVDLKLPNDTDDSAAIYVPLSCVKRFGRFNYHTALQLQCSHHKTKQISTC